MLYLHRQSSLVRIASSADKLLDQRLPHLVHSRLSAIFRVVPRHHLFLLLLQLKQCDIDTDFFSNNELPETHWALVFKHTVVSARFPSYSLNRFHLCSHWLWGRGHSLQLENATFLRLPCCHGLNPFVFESAGLDWAGIFELLHVCFDLEVVSVGSRRFVVKKRSVCAC